MRAAHVSAVKLAALTGEVSGTDASSPGGDTGRTTTLQGSGQVSPLGAVDVSGALTSPGFIATGHSGGAVTLSNDKGSVTLQLRGAPQKGFSALPSSLHYRIVEGSGSYSNLRGGGTVDLSFIEAAVDTIDAPGAGKAQPGPIVGSLFTLRFHR
jgi:hypothetical protein